jgi:AcrR family transcriptional regulator
VINLNKEKIIESAVKIMAQKGYNQTTTRMISKEAGVAVGTIYSNFKNKEDILNKVFEREYKKRIKFIETLYVKEVSNKDKISSFIDFHFENILEDLDLAKVLIVESSDLEISHLEWIKKFKIQIPDFFQKILSKGIENGEFRKLDSKIYSVIIFNSIRGLVEEITRTKNHNYAVKGKIELKKFIIKGIEKGER